MIMKRSFLAFFLVLGASMAGYSQYAVQFIYQHTFTVAQVDSILNAQVGSLATTAFSPIYAVKVYKVVYNTFDADSVPTTATGQLVVPQGTPCEAPILSFQHNNIIRKADAPSAYGFNSQWFIGLAGGSLGYISMMPDGIGLGSGPGFHVYLHLQSEATSVIDMIRAVKEGVDTMGASPNEQLFLAGVAEGGYATLAAHQYIQTYLDSIMHVTASGAIAPYIDLSGTQVASILSDSAYPDPSYLPELLLGYQKAYSFYASDSDVMIAPYDTTLPPLFNGNNRGSTIDSHMPSVPKAILQPSFIDTLQDDSANYFTRLLALNNAYNWAPTSPVNLLYCIADEYVPYQHCWVAYQHFIQNGADPSLIDTVEVGASLDHDECGQFSVLIAVQLIKSLVHQPIIATTASTASTSATIPNGTATVADSLGDPPYTWRWSTGDSTATITGLAAGTYYVTTTDMAHCTNVDSVTVSYVNGINDIAPANVGIYPNPTQGLIMIDNPNANDPLTLIEVLDIDGKVVNAPAVTNANITQLDLSAAAKGVYLLHIRSQSGGELHSKIVLM
jgi:hypothetical protein